MVGRSTRSPLGYSRDQSTTAPWQYNSARLVIRVSISDVLRRKVYATTPSFVSSASNVSRMELATTGWDEISTNIRWPSSTAARMAWEKWTELRRLATQYPLSRSAVVRGS